MRALFAILPACSLLVGQSAAAQTPEASSGARFQFEDLQSYARAHAEIRAGVPAETAMRGYVDRASPVLRAFMARYEITEDALAASLVRGVTRRPKYYAYVSSLQPRLEAQKPAVDRALARLLEVAPPEAAREGLVPVNFMLANATAGGTPVNLGPPDETPPRRAIAVALETMALGPDVDMSEFPGGAAGRAELKDVPTVIVHEMMHVLQARVQGFDNYTSIYRGQGDNLAIAIREGCADYVTWLASGWQLGNRHVYGQAHEQELWTEFRAVMHAPAFSTPGWFDGGDDARPEVPSQIGYWVGMRICQTYHETATDKAAAFREIFAAWRPEDFARIVAPYAARFD